MFRNANLVLCPDSCSKLNGKRRLVSAQNVHPQNHQDYKETIKMVPSPTVAVPLAVNPLLIKFTFPCWKTPTQE